jgi:hypothetical protein
VSVLLIIGVGSVWCWCELGSAFGKLIHDLCDAPEPEGNDPGLDWTATKSAQTGQGVLNAQRRHSVRCSDGPAKKINGSFSTSLGQSRNYP